MYEDDDGTEWITIDESKVRENMKRLAARPPLTTEEKAARMDQARLRVLELKRIQKRPSYKIRHWFRRIGREIRRRLIILWFIINYPRFIVRNYLKRRRLRNRKPPIS